MNRTSVTITSEDKQSAQSAGAHRLGVESDEVTVEHVRNSEYKVTLCNAPGQVTVVVADDKMSAEIEVLSPPIGDGNLVSVEDIGKALADKGVIFGIDSEAIRRAVGEVAATREPLKRVVVAKGDPAEDGQDASIEFRVGDGAIAEDPAAKHSVKQGQILAIKIPLMEGSIGSNILGMEISCRSGQDTDIEVGENVVLSKDGRTYTAAIYGVASVTDTSVSVQPSLQVNKDASAAVMTVFPILADGSRLTLEDVLAELQDAGVVSGINEDVISAALDADQPSPNVRVAEAEPAKDGVNASIAFKFSLNGRNPEEVDAERKKKKFSEKTVIKPLVFEGDVLAVKTSPQPPVEGRNVIGEVMVGNQPEDIVLTAGDNVELLENELEFVVADGVTGYANYFDGVLFVEDPIRVSDDNLTVHLCIHPSSTPDGLLTRERVEKMLDSRGITYGIDPRAIDSAALAAQKQNAPIHDVAIAQGLPPVKGKDGEVSFKFETEKSAGLLLEETDRLDYKERGTLCNVSSGTVLATRTRPGPGKEGVDVYGNAIQAIPGDERELASAENVAVSEDGLKYTAEADGVASLIGEDKIGVFQYYEIPGDVDYSTGNLEMDGILYIKGWVRSGFIVKADGDIVVGKGIEDATVEAGGNMEVHGGIGSKEKNSVRAAGHIQAQFLENANLHAGGNIIIQDSIIHSSVYAKGHVDVTGGKGRIIGGVISATKGVDAKVIGSDAIVKTLVDVGLDAKSRKKLKRMEKKLSKLHEAVKGIMLALGSTTRDQETPMSAKQARQIAELARLRREETAKETELNEYRRSLADAGSAMVRVRKSVHERTMIIVYGCQFPVKRSIAEAGMFILSTKDRKSVSVKYVG